MGKVGYIESINPLLEITLIILVITISINELNLPLKKDPWIVGGQSAIYSIQQIHLK